MEVSRQEVAYQLAKNTDASGAWSEGIHYQPVGYGPLLHGAYALKVNGMLDDRLARLAAMPSQYMLRLVSPPDPRMAIWERWWQDKEPHGPTRAVQGWGHEQLYSYLHWLEAAAVVRDADPAMARSLTWMWDHVGRPQADSYGMHANHMADFAERVAVHADLVNTIPKGYVPPELNSSWLPSMGATLRAHVGNPDETFLSARMGYFHSHTDPNHGDFVLYAKGAPLVSMSSRVYVVLSTAPEVMALNKEFGWASAVRFGSRDNVGHWAGGVPTAGIYTHLFSDSVDYLRGLGDYDPQQWARQILFLKGKAADGPNYFVFRDSFTPLGSDAKNLQQTFWTIKNPGKKEWVTRTDTGLEFTSSFGPKLNLRFLQPATVASESREAADIHNRGAAEAAPDRHLFTVTSFGPIAAGQDVLAVLYPRQAEEVVPAYTKLADGAARIVTSEGTDFVFLGHGAMQYAGNDISFDGVAGAVRVYPDEVHLVIAEGPSRIMYKGMELRSEIPVCKIIPLKQVKDGKVITNPTPELTPKPALPKLKNPVQLAPGVTRGACTEGIAYTFDSATAISFEQEGVRFVGKQGMLVINENAGTVRCVLRNGTRIGYKGAQIWSAPGPYDITFFPDRIAGRYVGPGRLAFMTMPDGLITQPTYVLDGQTFAVGTDWRTLIVPFMSGEHAFEIRTLAQPAVFRNWQAWE
ncbi:MAG: hypothetical protein BWY76_00531 [bacterium ADurb.Bin429]|nr:MAG: hypothetical protein BWY76_00531 [bacterium ADurb.Bin429]